MLAQEEDKEVRRAFDSRPGKRRRLNGPAVDGELSSSDDEDVRMGVEGDAPMRAAKSRSTSPQPIIVEDQPFQPQRSAVKHEPVVGGALQRNADGTPVAPIVKKRGTKVRGSSACAYMLLALFPLRSSVFPVATAYIHLPYTLAPALIHYTPRTHPKP